MLTLLILQKSCADNNFQSLEALIFTFHLPQITGRTYNSNLAVFSSFSSFSQAHDRYFCGQPLSVMWYFSQMLSQYPSDSTIGCICSHLMTLLLRVLLNGEQVIPEITLSNLPSHVCIKSPAVPFSESKSSAGGCLCLWTTSVKNLLHFNERKGWKERESGGCLSLIFQDLVGILH